VPWQLCKPTEVLALVMVLVPGMVMTVNRSQALSCGATETDFPSSETDKNFPVCVLHREMAPALGESLNCLQGDSVVRVVVVMLRAEDTEK
jgi:hypothetical protein